MNNEDTLIFSRDSISEKIIYDTLKEVFDILKERGYNPINQIVGYIQSGDLGYISSYKDARVKIANLDRSTLVEVLLKSFLKCDI